MHLVGDQKSDLGNGYFELLLRKARRMEEREEYDGAMKQVFYCRDQLIELSDRKPYFRQFGFHSLVQSFYCLLFFYYF